MKLALLVGATSSLFTLSYAHAGGIDRTGQPVTILFEQGNYAELSFGRASPSAKGTDAAIGAYPGGVATGNALGAYNSLSFAYKHQFNENWSGALVLDQPFGADIYYPADASLTLGGTSAEVNSSSLTALLRYKIPQSEFGVHGGLRVTQTNGTLSLGGAVMGPVNGYRLESDDHTGVGWVAGVSWERPEIAARVSLTYSSQINHDFNVTESGPAIDPDGAGPYPAMPLLNGSSSLRVSMPESWNLEFQTGVAENTLVFGSIRWAEWSSFRIDPVQLWGVTGAGLVDLDDTTTLTLGVGHRFNENWSGAASVSYEKSGSDLVSPFSPANGSKGVTLAAVYSQDNIRITTGVSYVALGDARPTVTGVTAANLEGSHVWGVGMKIGYSF